MVLNPLIIVAEVLYLWGPEGPLVLKVDASRRQGRSVSFCVFCSFVDQGCVASASSDSWFMPLTHLLFYLWDVPQTLNIQHSHPSSGFLHGRRLMNKDVVALAGVFDFALWCLCCRSISLSASLVLNISPSVLRASEGRKCDRLFPLSP